VFVCGDVCEGALHAALFEANAWCKLPQEKPRERESLYGEF